MTSYKKLIHVTASLDHNCLSMEGNMGQNCDYRYISLNTYISLKISTCLHNSIQRFTRSKIENDRILDHVISV